MINGENVVSLKVNEKFEVAMQKVLILKPTTKKDVGFVMIGVKGAVT